MRDGILERTVSRHYKHRRAVVVCAALTYTLRTTDVGEKLQWLHDSHMPTWTDHFEVRPARLRFHYRVVAVSAPRTDPIR